MVKTLDRLHVLNESTVFTVLVVVVASSIDKSETPQPTLSQQVVDDPRLRLVEVIVHDGEGDIPEVGGAEQSRETHIEVGRDGVGGVGAALPPVHAEEAEREDDDAAPDHGAHQAAHVHRLHLHPRNGDVRVDEPLAVRVGKTVQPALQRERVAREDEHVRVHHHAHPHPHPAHHRVHLDHRLLPVHAHARPVHQKCYIIQKLPNEFTNAGTVTNISRYFFQLITT